MEHIDKGEICNISSPYINDRIYFDYPEAAQRIGAAIAFIVVIFGWAISKIFRKDLLW